MKKIAILGMGEGWDRGEKKDYDEIWAVSPLVCRRDDIDLVFQMHNLDWSAADNAYLELKGDRENFWDSIWIINEKKIRIMLQEEHEFFPDGEVFPLDEMPALYFTSTFAYMVAYAIYKGVEEIDIYGVPLVLEGEYREQRSCLEFWIGFAAGRGIKVNLYGTTILLSSIPYEGLYGYDW
jgi:hypothetical protein